MAAQNPVPIARTDPAAEVRVFISYAHQDRGVALALERILRDINKSRVVCFVDVNSIDAGTKYEEVIRQHLSQADWFIGLFTGEHSEYCGFEVGIFSQIKRTSADDELGGRLLCLYDTPEAPSLFSAYENYRVKGPEKALDEDARTDFYSHSPLYRFLDCFCGYNGLRHPSPGNRDEYRDFLIEKADNLTSAFRDARGEDVQEETILLPRLELEIPKSLEGPRSDGVASEPVLLKIPDDAVLTGREGAFSIFSLQLPSGRNQITWKELCQHIRSREGDLYPWIRRIEKDVVEASQRHILESAEITLKARDGRIYHPLLTRHKLFQNGARKFYIVFVETIPRQFLGRQRTSFLLAGLVLASRFRFAYFEEWDRIAVTKFGSGLSDIEFAANCTQLLYDLERMEHEAAEFGLLDPHDLVAAFGDENRAVVESFLRVWGEQKRKLLSGIDGLSGEEQAFNRQRAEESIRSFFEAMRPENRRFIRLALQTYGTETLRLLDQEESTTTTP
jgi:hypothetical protein